MPDPERTFHMIRWICQGHWQDLDAWLDDQPDAGRVNVDRLFELFPALEAATTLRRLKGQYEGRDLRTAFKRAVTDKLSISQSFPKALPLTIEWGQFNDHLEINEGSWDSDAPPMAMAFAVKGEQGDVLAKFDRRTQEQLATWQLHVPENLVDGRLTDPSHGTASDKMGHGDYRFCLHPEGEHGHWQKRYAALTSRGVSHGFGAVLKFHAQKLICQVGDLEVEHLGWNGSDLNLRFTLS